MAKYVQIPRKPRECEAVQYLGVVAGVPTISENVLPTWFAAAFARGTLKLAGEELTINGSPVDVGDYLLVDLDDVTGDGMWSSTADNFATGWRRKRKVPVQRKPRAKKLEVAA